MNLDDTIVAIATPPGRGGIGIVRLAGPEARAIATPMLRLKHDLEPGRAVFGELIEPGGNDPAESELKAENQSLRAGSKTLAWYRGGMLRRQLRSMGMAASSLGPS